MGTANIGYDLLWQKQGITGRNIVGSRSATVPDNWPEFAGLCKIRSGTKIISFTPYDYQLALIEAIESHQTTVATKTRQLGFTETIVNYFLWKACRNDGYLSVIFSKSQSDTSNIAKRLRRQIDGLNQYIATKTDSLTDIELVNGGRILFRNSTPNGARGLESVSDILYDEAAFVDDIEEIYKASTPCTTVLGDKARIVINSTPNGQSGWYWDKLSDNNGDQDVLEICDGVRSGAINPVQNWTDDSGWCKFICHWKAHPIFGSEPDYLANVQKRLELPEYQIEQEYNLSFYHSEVIVFASSLVKENAIAEWESEPDENASYYMGIDTSLLGNDYTVCTILKIVEDTFHLVKLYRQRKKTHEYNIYQIKELIDLYRPRSVGIEVNSAGQLYYEQLYNHCPSTDFTPIKTTAVSKPVMINKLILAMEKHLIAYPNERYIIEEFLSFRQVGNSLEAVAGKHDDIIMSLSFAVNVAPILL
jgi:phage FluMu gp28-like protein